MQAMRLPGVKPGAQAWGLYVAATLQAPLLLVGQRQCVFRLASQGPPLLDRHRCEAPRAPVITSMLFRLVGYGSGFQTPAT